MHRLVGLPNPRQAQAFIDYMASRGITIQMASEPEGVFALWLADRQYLVEVEAELAAFIADPYAKRYSAASWEVAESRTAKFYYQNPSLLKMVKTQAGPFSLSVMVVVITIYVLWFLGFRQPIFALTHFPTMQGDEWQLWRYFSHALIHFSALHIVFNCLWWWILGGQLEQHSGSGKLIQVFLFSALISGFAQFWLHGANFGGLSGVVYALMGYIWWLGWLAPERGLVLPKPYVGFMLAWLVIGFAEPFGMSIANMAHLFGLLSGCALGFIDAKRTPSHA
ncbi:rhomboid family intramembrane serine protease GlpG [Photobacterium sanguinicancri]|uniref:Rhomboid family intramembrane serine protease GlpG n=1 Tax=Photobacterium sanguinicancri TaxID=875932 RepID=A0AAW7Y7E2_9GAMM|nr:rhomboid family intramembrane serine protease GlpG [Photobacterium sanguinicancri]KXI23953.1 rhomboid family intramembrane serine protease GlpG [Photobacterium sanguinicancri]MDO6543193.1 rhomboid family intramembrane serine protease GlpG [Photobacterium sanguinicancri]OZS44498.1 rhomboid family intramembrane serine protease GlpG [Photobacterium sanguinicancri]